MRPNENPGCQGVTLMLVLAEKELITKKKQNCHQQRNHPECLIMPSDPQEAVLLSYTCK